MNGCSILFVTAAFIGWICLSLMSSANAGVTCLACSYTFAGEDGSTDIQCVNDVYNFSKTSQVPCPNTCVTRVVYTTGYKRINSIFRSCATTENNVGCDAADNYSPTCILTCAADKCNDQNGNFWNGPGNGSPGASSRVLSLAFSLLIYFVCTYL
ncbi:unnamed protein product [Lymnaea stagnalis]|uniref:Uncharacterized protein n=1 Tax=Lymnaea stagnalis TaxID=6523 RepID=A0AAV2H643_LYMST